MKQIPSNQPQFHYKYPNPCSPSTNLCPNTTPPPMPHHSSTWSPSSFEAFFHRWLVRQEHYLDELLSADPTNCSQNLITRVLAHYHDYFEAKSDVTLNDVFLVFSPTWFSSFERSFLWIAGFKPALVFRLLGNAVDDLTAEQRDRVLELRREVEAEEAELERVLAMVQEGVAAPAMVEMARRAGRLVDGEIREADDLIEVLKNSMKDLVQRADHLRLETAQKVIDILNPAQGVKLLVSAGKLQLRIRNCGALSQQPRNR